LKSSGGMVPKTGNIVAPYMGAWIEIIA
jgi:hypothetical protein